MSFFTIYNNLIAGGDNGSGGSSSYRSLEDLPSFGTATTIGTADGPVISLSEFGGNDVIRLAANFEDTLELDTDVTGSAEDLKYLDLNGFTIGGGTNVSSGQKVLVMEGDGTNYVWAGNGTIQGPTNDALTGVIGVTFGPNSAGSVFKLQRLNIFDNYFAGIFANVVRSGQDYGDIEIVNVIVDAYNTEGEGAYLNTTAKGSGTYGLYNLLKVRDSIFTNKGRDGFQVNSCLDLRVNNIVVYDVGKDAQSGQWFLTQLQNVNGYVINSIFDTAPGVSILAAHGFTFYNNFWNITSTSGAFIIQQLSGEYPDQDAVNNRPIIFYRQIFHATLPVASLFNIQEDECDIYFIDCIKTDNITSLYTDNRGDTATYSITEINTTEVPAASIDAPSYVSTDRTSDDFLKVDTDTTPFTRGMGIRTPFEYDVLAVNPYVTGTVEVGETLTANYTFISLVGTTESGTTYQWYNSDGAISGATSSTYTVQSTDDFKNIYFEVTVSDGTNTGPAIRSGNYQVQNTFTSLNPVSLYIFDPSTDLASANTNGSAFTGGTQRGSSWGDVIVSDVASSSAPTYDSSEDALDIVDANNDMIQISDRPTVPDGWTEIMFMKLPVASDTRNLSGDGSSNSLRIDGGENITVNNNGGGSPSIDLPEDQYHGFKLYRKDGTNAWNILIRGNPSQDLTGNKYENEIVNSGTTTNSNVGFAGSWEIGSRGDTTSTATMKFIAHAVYETDISDAQFEAMCQYIHDNVHTLDNIS